MSEKPYTDVSAQNDKKRKINENNAISIDEDNVIENIIREKVDKIFAEHKISEKIEKILEKKFK